MRAVRILYAVGTCILGACLIQTACRETPRSRVLFVGIDGATWKIIGRLLDEGELPGVARLTREGAYMPRFDTMGTTHSPLVWTSVATGRLPEDHGIVQYTEKLPSGKMIPASSNTRKVQAIWNVATESGLRVGVLGWWASWPAEEVAGYVVTDHANPASVRWRRQNLRYWTANPEILRAIQRDVFPADLAPILQDHWLDRDRFPFAEIQRRSQLSDAQMQALKPRPGISTDPTPGSRLHSPSTIPSS